MRVAIVGSGLQCQRRAPVIASSKEDQLAIICGITRESTEAAARRFNCRAAENWRHVVVRDDIDAVLVCTPPDIHAEIGIAALRNGKHVLCEKPLCRTLEEARAIIAAVRASGRVFKCGFNHRFHPAIMEMKRLADGGDLGRPMFGRCRYGLIGRPGFEQEWRADPKRAAGGQLAEQGIHGIDLFRWFLGEIVDVSCMTATHYFTAQSLEDNGMATFRTALGATASLHSSMTQWKNLFSFEIFGEDAYAIAQGLGSSYGTETLTWGRRDFDAPFSDTTIEYRGGDSSWAAEWRDFTHAVREGRQPSIGTAEDGLQALRVALACYESNQSRRFVGLDEFGREVT